MSLKGGDTTGRQYENVDEMWRAEVGENPDEEEEELPWYTKAVEYWKSVDATVDGVLGGFAAVSPSDLRESEAFLKRVLLDSGVQLDPANSVAVDCGAGIGRITQGLLLNFCAHVDLVEPCAHFLDGAKAQLAGQAARCSFLCQGLQDFCPEEQRYDIIWVQWVAGHLTDDDLCAFFVRCSRSIKRTGLIFLKENTHRTGFLVDKQDSSVTRSDAYFKELFRRSGLKLLCEQTQVDFPKDLFKVRMYALN